MTTPDTPAAAVRSRAVVIDGTRTPLRESGPTTGAEAVVFVHGNPGSGEDWTTLLQQVGTFARGIAPDMPGFGGADKPADFQYTVRGYARHLDRLLGTLGIERAHLVLHDFGGAWGLAWAATRPDLVASMTLFNVGVLPGYRWHYLAKIWRAPILGELFMATMTRVGFGLALKHGNPRGLPVPFVDRMYHDFDRGTRRAVLRLYRATPDLGGRLADELAAALRPLNRPALVVWGARDPYLPVAYAERQRDVFPGARIVVLPQSGHWPFADDPERVSQEVLPFLREHVGGGRTDSA